MITGPGRAHDARDSVQFGDLVRFRPGPLSSRWLQGTVSGWLRGGFVVSCTDGIARRVAPNQAERVG